MSPWIWFAVVALLLVAEMLTVHLVFASLALAAFAAAIANVLGFSLVSQGAMFAVFAVVSLVFLRPTALRHLNKQDPNEATNVDALVGAPAVTTSVINQAGGQVKLSGEIWSAHTLGEDIDVNERVTVVAIDGASARVIKAEEK
jgi:membrane protein implicated in regulation of membrane protease activity